MGATVHASAVVAGPKAVLIRAPSGGGKSRLALALLDAGQSGALPFARLVGDDRVILEPHGGRLLVRGAPELAGVLEVRGLGLRHVPYEPVAVVGLIVDLEDPAAERLPAARAREAHVCGVKLPRVAVAPGVAPLPLVLAALRTAEIGV